MVATLGWQIRHRIEQSSTGWIRTELESLIVKTNKQIEILRFPKLVSEITIWPQNFWSDSFEDINFSKNSSLNTKVFWTSKTVKSF